MLGGRTIGLGWRYVEWLHNECGIGHGFLLARSRAVDADSDLLPHLWIRCCGWADHFEKAGS